MLFPLVGSVAALVALTGAAVPVTDVEIAIAASPPAAGVAVREDLEDLLSRRGLAARYRQLERVTRDEVLRPAAEAPCALACIWLDLGVTNPARAFVYVSPTAAPEVLIRSLPLPGGVDEVAREEVAHIVATSVEALREGRPLPPPTNAADLPLAKTVREPAPPPRVRPPRTLWLAGAGAGAAHEGGSQSAFPIGGLSLVVAAEDRRLAPALWVTLGAFSSDAGSDGVALRSRGGELAVMGAIGTHAVDQQGARRRAAVRLGLGAGLELREATPSAVSGAMGVSVDPARVEASGFVRAAARLEVRLFEPLGLFVAAACDARVVSHRYTVERDGVTAPLFQPDLLRPSLLLGLDARLPTEAP